ncbi:MAG: FecR family protein [Bacteroidales bacterium]|nr:FecR family protein [Bacteroidales bacterium]
MEGLDKEIINNVLENTSSKEEAAKVVSWFVDSIEGQNYLSESMDRDFYLMEENEDQSDLISPIQSATVLAKINKATKRKQLKNILFKVAAILIPFVFIIGMSIYLTTQVGLFDNSNYSEIYVPKGETMRILFQDGSQAYLNSGTKMTYPEKFGLKNRKVFLEGEAYFNVSSNKKRPFIVETDKANITVLGTSFNINAYGNDSIVEVVLDEGEIVLGVDKRSYAILPGQKVTYNKVDGLTSIANLDKSLQESMWRNNVLHFSNTPLLDVVKTLNRRYDIRFVIEDSATLEYTYTLTSKQTSIEEILLELEKITPVKFVLTGNKVHVNL